MADKPKPMKRKFNFEEATLISAAKTIVAALTKYATQLGQRVTDVRRQQLQALLTTVSGSPAAKQTEKADLGDLTDEEVRHMERLEKLMNKLRGFAKKALEGHAVKLREVYYVGAPKSNKLSVVEERAGVMLAAAQSTTDAPLLAGKGWLPADSTLLAAELGLTGDTDQTQEGKKGEKLGGTAAATTAENDLYDGLREMQGIADYVFPADDPANVQARADFLLGTFPPKHKGPDKPKPGTTQPPQP